MTAMERSCRRLCLQMFSRIRGGHLVLIEPDGRRLSFGDADSELGRDGRDPLDRTSTARCSAAASASARPTGTGSGTATTSSRWRGSPPANMLPLDRWRAPAAPGARAAPADALARPAQQQRAALAPAHLRPLRPRQRPVRALPRRVDDVLERSLPEPEATPGRGPAAPAGADLPGARARPRRPPARDRHRLGRDGRLRGRAATAAGSRQRRSRPEQRAGALRADPGRRASRTASRSCSSDYRDLRGRYSKLVSLEMIEAVGWQYFDSFFRRCSELLEPDGLFFLQAIVDRRPPLRAREGDPELLQQADLPRRLPALGRGDPALRRAPDRHVARSGWRRSAPTTPARSSSGASASSPTPTSPPSSATTSRSGGSGRSGWR